MKPIPICQHQNCMKIARLIVYRTPTNAKRKFDNLLLCQEHFDGLKTLRGWKKAVAYPLIVDEQTKGKE